MHTLDRDAAASSPASSTRAAGGGQARMSRGLVALLAVACGAAVANLYYIQPLLGVVAHAFDISDATAGLLVTCAQVGYVIGLAFLVPVGDITERRRLVSVVLLGTAAALGLCAGAPSFAVHRLHAHARSRLTTAYMVSVFLGGIVGSTLSTTLYAAGGWHAVCVLGAALALTAIVVLAASRRH